MQQQHHKTLICILGGSETFNDKQEHFFKELRDIHRKHPRDKLTLKITRENIIESVRTF